MKSEVKGYTAAPIPDPAAVGLIGVLLGGPSAEREISLKSGRAVSRALREAGYRVVEIGEKEEIEAGIRFQRPAAAFISLHGRYGEDGEVQRLLEEMDIPYTGSGIEASRRAMDKVESRRIFAAAGLSVPPGRVYGPDLVPGSPPFPFPVVVKPAREGSSIGLSLVRGPEEFAPAVKRAREHDREILVEEYIPGRELTAGILDDRPLPLVEIKPGNPFFDFEAKYVRGRSEFVVPAPLPPAQYRQAQELGLAAHRVLGCFSYSRADIIIAASGRPFLLEVNTIPGFTATSLLPQAAAAAGIDFPELCRRLLADALTRGNYRSKETAKEAPD
ncbi:MAG: D-alanine--D-alanine ligase [Candidatus Erginobacter occultus]|nr:D-alanine--D-alanine ligase [Candidatus Erginobacter occultus]